MYKDVETWVRQNNDEYKEPASFEFEKNSLDAFQNIPPELGEHIRKELFYFKPDLTFIAHGSYGGVPKPVLNYYQDCQVHIEEQPVQFFYDELYPHVIKSLRECAYSVGAKPNQITFVPNVEFGMNAILRSIDFKEGERVLMFDITYGAVKMTVDYISKSSGVVLELMSLKFPIKDFKDILDQFEDYLSKNTNVDGKGKIRSAAFEHITSPTAIVFPVKEMIQICHKYDIMVMIDGAHAWGQVKLDLQALDPDFYVTNGHKWLCNVRGAALMYVKEELQSMIHPPVLSWGLNQGFHSEFIWMGTMDYCPMISARIALKFFEWLGVDKVHKYNTELIEWATNMLTTVWNSETLVPLQMCQYMAVVHVPDSKEACSGEDSCQMSNLHDQLLKDHQIEVPIFTFKGKRWARISAHVYNTKHDFTQFAQAVITTQKLGEEAQEKLNKYKFDLDPSNK